MKFIKSYTYDKIRTDGWHNFSYIHKYRNIVIIISCVLTIFIVTIFRVYTHFDKELLLPFIIDSLNLSIYSRLEKAGVILLLTLIIFSIYIPVHELIHILFYPKGIMSKNIFITYGQGAIGVGYDGVLSKENFMITSIAPFVIINIVSLASLLLIKGFVGYMFLYCMIINFVLSCLDIWIFAFMLLKLPSKAKIYDWYWIENEKYIFRNQSV